MLTRIDTDEIDADSDSITGDEGVGVKSIELPDEEETCSCSSDGGLADCMLDETAFVLEVAKDFCQKRTLICCKSGLC